jgi:Killing trait
MSHHTDSFADRVRGIGEACAAVLALLNQVTAIKRESILGLAEQGSHDGEEAGSGRAAAPASRSAADATKPVESAAATATAQPASPIHLLECAAVQAIAMALHNTVAADQQLDILAQAVLARKAALVMGGGAALKPQNAGEDGGASGARGG